MFFATVTNQIQLVILFLKQQNLSGFFPQTDMVVILTAYD